MTRSLKKKKGLFGEALFLTTSHLVVLLIFKKNTIFSGDNPALVHCFLTDDLLSSLDRPQSLTKVEDILKKKKKKVVTPKIA